MTGFEDLLGSAVEAKRACWASFRSGLQAAHPAPDGWHLRASPDGPAAWHLFRDGRVVAVVQRVGCGFWRGDQPVLFGAALFMPDGSVVLPEPIEGFQAATNGVERLWAVKQGQPDPAAPPLPRVEERIPPPLDEEGGRRPG